MAKNIVEYILDIKTNKAEKGLKDVSKEANRAERELKQVNKAGAGMAVASKAVAGLGLAVGAGAVAVGALVVAMKSAITTAANMTKEVVDSVNRLNDLSARSGVAASSIQALSLAFQASGQEGSKADAFISKFPKVYSALATEGSRAALAAEDLGVKIRKSDGAMKSSNELLFELTAGLQSVEDDSKRAAIGFNLFGGAAGDLIQALGKTANLEKFLTFADQFGVKVGEEASQAAADFQLQLAFLEVGFDGLKQKLINAVGGVGLFNKILLKAIMVTVGMQEMISNNQDAFESFGNGMAKLARGFFGVLQSMWSEFGTVINFAATMIALKIGKVATMLHFLGAISDSTFASAMEMAQGLQEVGTSSQQIGGALEDFSFDDIKSGQEVLAELESIIAGIDKQAGSTGVSLNDLKDTLEEVETAADGAGGANNTAEMIRTESEKQYDAVVESIEGFLAKTKESIANSGLTAQETKIKDLRSTIDQLSQSIIFLNDNALPISEAVELRAQVQDELNNVLNEGSEIVEKTTNAFENLFQGLANAVGNISDPSSFLGSIPALMEGLPQIFDFVAKEAAELSGRLAMDALNQQGNQGDLLAKGAMSAGSISSMAAGGAGLAASAAAAVPVVAAVGALVNGLAKLGESSTAEIDDQFETFISNLEKGFSVLPGVIIKVLPEFIVQLAKLLTIDMTRLIVFDLPIALIQGLVMLIPHLINEIVLLIADIFKGTVRIIEGITNFIRTISTKEGWEKIGDSIVEAIQDQLKFSRNFLEDAFAMRSGGRFIPSARGGIRFTGADEGMAMLHRGEFVVPESNVAPQAVDRRLRQEMQGGINLIINADIIEGSAIDELVRKIEQRFGTFGASTSNLFGGV